ncbi:hypothetical protein AWZ03_005223 [Drosophila navojoa]|uniref:Vacuolar protein sorting-associated protein 13 n=1 Tax=Drosophila navojoa TaxID=7232 RepID=A0A484BHM4_DRONA|nr:vacuolar protein sorting-associated protein 13 [Drosophila navojoa]TDG48268.1 hypothetical protein AWZ03_005223 [Drosophila navojoa]
MVFEAIVADVLNKVLGDYIENLDHKQLKIGIWGGDVVLTNLQIRSNALDDMDLPVQLVYGYLGKLVLKIPWKNLYSQPVIADIDGLYVLVTPNNDVRYNAEKEQNKNLATKMAALNAQEAAMKKELEPAVPKGDAGFAEKLTAQIVNNLQVKISNVHFRYEDSTTTGSAFSFGITLNELELYTTDNNWDKTYMTERAPEVFKIANLSCLAAYMNCKARLYASQEREKLVETFKDQIARKDYKPTNYCYVLGPISCITKLKLNMNPELDEPAFEKPKIDLSLEMETLNVGLTNKQFQYLIQLGDAMNRMQLGLPYRQYRPYNIPYKGHAKEWWKFAITAVLEYDIRRPKRTWTWNYIKDHRERCNEYAEKYKERELAKKPTKTLEESCKMLEEKLDLFNLLLIRQRVNIEIVKYRESIPPRQTSWLGNWWGGNSAKSDGDEGTSQKLVRKFEAAMTPEEKAKMYKAIGYEENMKPQDVPIEYVALKMNFKLIALEMGLYQEVQLDADQSSALDYFNLPSIILLKFSMATATILQRPAADALSLTAGMKCLQMTGVTQNDRAPMLIESITTDEFNLLDIFFETNPIDKQCNQRVKVVARPLQITYDSKTIMAVSSVFKPPTDVNLSKFEETAASKLVDIKERSATGMQYVIDQKSILDADILLMPNILVVPHGGYYVSDEKALIVLSMGQVHVTTKPHKRTAEQVRALHEEGVEQKDILKSVMENSYDRFIVEVNDVQILMVRPHEPWQSVLHMAESTESHVLLPTSLKVEAALCVFDNDPRLPKIKIDIVMPAVQLSITEDRMLEAIDLVTNLPLPQSDTPDLSPVLQRSRSSISNFINREIKRRTTPVPEAEQTLQDEIIQYTQVEVTFSLQKITLRLTESNRRCETDADTESTYATPELETLTSSGELSTLTDPQQEVNQTLLFEILQVETYMAQRTYETVASVKLGSINLKHYDCVDSADNVLDIINTPGYIKDEKYLLTISYTMADKLSPEFNTKYNSVEQLMVANFEVLDVILHQECLQRLLQMANDFQKRMDAILLNLKPRDRYASAADGDGLKHKLQAIMEDAETMVTSQKMSTRHSKGRKKLIVDTVKMRMIANIEAISLKLTSRKRPLSLMQVKHFVTNITLKDSYTEVNIGLKDIVMLDLNPNTIHTKILTIVGQDAFNCQVVLFNKEYTRNYNSDDMKITVDIGCMKIVFLNWFVAGLLNFSSHFQTAQDAFTNASAAAAQSAKQNAISAYEKATRMKLNIRIKAPVILVPVDSQSTDALAIDLGLLEMTNTTTETPVPSVDQYAVIDEIKLQLKDVKISKVVILERDDSRHDDVDAVLGIKTSVNMMDPISFTLTVTRNLSFTWYTDVPEMNLSGHLKSVELTLYMDDYALIMSILNKNLREGLNEFPLKEVEIKQPPSHTVQRTGTLVEPSGSVQISDDPLKVCESLKINFQFDGVIINLMEEENEGLACFGIYYLSVKGTKLNNGTFSVSVVLCNIQLDDTRSSNKSKIRQYLSCKNWDAEKSKKNKILETCQKEVWNYMVDITAIIKEDDVFAEVRVRSFDLIVCIDFLMKLTLFLTLPVEPQPREPGLRQEKSPYKEIATTARESARKTVDTQTAQDPTKKMNLILHIDQPDIILVESLDDLNTNAIIFNAQAHLNYRSIGDKQIINGEITALKIYMCSFLPERRDATRHYILHPAVISLQGSTPESEGLHISLKLSDIIVNISPTTIELLNKAMLSITSGVAEKAAIDRDATDYSKIWYPKPFHSKTYWFTKVEEAIEAQEIPLQNEVEKTEKCVIEMPSITLVIESGQGYYTKPLLSLDTRMTAVFNNWSSNFTAHGSLTLNMNYYNQFMAEWEPIIELNEVLGRNGIREYIPWELQFDMSFEKMETDFDELQEDTAMNIRIHSKENLEITISKTCLSLLSELGEAFSQAIDKKGIQKPEVTAPYVVINDTGFDITLNLECGVFTLHEVHRGGKLTNNALVLHAINSAEDQLVDPVDIKSCTISPGGKAYLQTKDMSTISESQIDDYNLYVTLGDLSDEIVLPVSKADTRYFPLPNTALPEQWAIVSQVKLEYGTTKINIHGVLSLLNHFTRPVEVLRRHETENRFIRVGVAKPNEVFNVPLHAIYASDKELYFSIKGYNTSAQSLSWYINPSDMNYESQVQCEPIDAFEPLNMNLQRRKHEIFFENTNKYRLRSAHYMVHIRPPLSLRNCLPIDIKVSVAGCLGRQTNTDTAGRGSTDKPDVEERYEKQDFLDFGEKGVNPGHILHLPTVRTTANGKEAKSVLVIRLLQYLEKDWSHASEIPDPSDDVTVWTFSSYDSDVKMEMDLFVRCTKVSGKIILTLYSPYWMINKTGKMLTYKSDLTSVEMLYHPPEYSGPILLAFRDKMFFDKKKAAIRIESGEWSEKIPLDVAGSIGGVTCTANNQKFQIGVHNHLTNNSLTKQITFIPFYIVHNKCRHTIELQELNRPGDPWLAVEELEYKPLWPKSETHRKLILRVGQQVTPAFDYTEASCTLLKLPNSPYGGVNVDVQSTEGGVYLTFTEYQPSEAPGLIINHTSKDLIYYEKNTEKMNTLKPKHCVLFAWDDPMGPKILVFGKDKQETDLKRDEIDTVTLQNDSKAYWVSFLYGMQRVLLVTEVEAVAKRTESTAALQTITRSIDLHIHGIGISVVNNEAALDILYLGITSSGIVWESRKPNKKRFKEMTIHDSELIEAEYQRYLVHKSVKEVKTYLLNNKFPLDFNTMTITKHIARRLRRNFYPAIWVSLKSSPFQNQLHVKINRIQVDNQLVDPIFNVVLAPIAPPKSVATTTSMKPFIECSIVQRVIPNSDVKQYKYASILIQEFHFKVDIVFLTAIAEMFSTEVTDEQAAKLFRSDVDSIELPLSTFFEEHSQQEQKNYYDNLHLGPLKIHVSFSMAGADAISLPGFLGTLVQGVGVTLTDVNDVVFRLAFFEREFQFFTQHQLISDVTSHYKGQALKQLYVLALGLDVLGNPYGLVVGLKKGVEDLFYEPFQGAIQGPGEFAEGLVLGVKSLFGHTVGGAAGAMSKITGAMGKGLAALTFDDKYQKKRRRGMHNKPKNFHEGLARSGKGLVMGFYDGVTGVVTKPVAGARDEGVEGFFKGLGKGAIGLVARPTAGVVDFASGSFEAVKRATVGIEDARRLRPTRFLHYDYVLRPYCYSEALGNKILKEVDKGKYAETDNFVHCEEIVRRSEYLIITNHRMIYAQRNDMFGVWNSLWSYQWEEVDSFLNNGRGMQFKVISRESKGIMGLFSPKESNTKIVLVPDERRREALLAVVESQMRAGTQLRMPTSRYSTRII